MSLGAPQDGHVQVAPDSTGKKIDNAELTRDDGTIVERQRTVIGSDENPRQQLMLGGDVGRGYILVDSRAFDELNEKMDDIMNLLTLHLES
jgi:hypothetical protein